jgi:hypothetical protein
LIVGKVNNLNLINEKTNVKFNVKSPAIAGLFTLNN